MTSLRDLLCLPSPLKHRHRLKEGRSGHRTLAASKQDRYSATAAFFAFANLQPMCCQGKMWDISARSVGSREVCYAANPGRFNGSRFDGHACTTSAALGRNYACNLQLECLPKAKTSRHPTPILHGATSDNILSQDWRSVNPAPLTQSPTKPLSATPRSLQCRPHAPGCPTN